jgi:hypothetical protein
MHPVFRFSQGSEKLVTLVLWPIREFPSDYSYVVNAIGNYLSNSNKTGQKRFQGRIGNRTHREN